MNKFIQKIYLLIAAGFSGGIFSVAMPNAIATPNPDKQCQPVARDIETQKIYCAHELKSLKSQRRANQTPGILCYLVRRVFLFNAFIDLSQCVPKDSGYQLDSGNERIIPKPKGSQTSLAILQPLGKTLITSQPDLAWSAVPKAVSYRVSLEQGGQWIWTQEVDRAKLQFPSTHALQPGRSYKLSVVAFGKDDQVIDEEFKSLRLVDPQTLTEIDNAVSVSMKSSSNSLVKGIDRAMMLYHAGLVDAAVNQLESLIKFQEPLVYSQLGLIYKRAGQPEIAQMYLKKASELVNQKPRPVSREETQS